MYSIGIMFLTAVLVTELGLSSAFRPQDSPMLAFLQSGVSEVEAVTPTNATAQTDLQAMIMRSSCYIAGPYGGNGGGFFNDFIDNCNAVIKKIAIRAGNVVAGIQVTYQLSNGKIRTSRHHGGGGGKLHYIHLNVAGGERINGIFGKSGALVDQIGFVTNKGRIFGPYGSCGGGSFHVNSCHLRGFFGRSGGLVDNIGFFCSKA